jgi:hypothetical protein
MYQCGFAILFFENIDNNYNFREVNVECGYHLYYQ